MRISHAKHAFDFTKSITTPFIKSTTKPLSKLNSNFPRQSNNRDIMSNDQKNHHHLPYKKKSKFCSMVRKLKDENTEFKNMIQESKEKTTHFLNEQEFEKWIDKFGTLKTVLEEGQIFGEEALDEKKPDTTKNSPWIHA